MSKHYTVFDLETGANKLHKRKGSPFDSRNKIYVNAYKTQGSPSVLTQYSREGVKKISIPWATTELLVGQNIKFDLLWIWKDPDFREWLRNGGKIYDTMVAEFLLTAQQSQYCSLNKLAEKYGGTQKVDVIKEYWESGIDTCDIDPAILLPYAESDILNTEKAFLAQMEAIRRESMGGLVEGYMDHLLALVEMEFNGLYLDIPGTLQLRTELEKKQADLAAQMQKICDVFTDRLGIPRYEFTPTKPKDISAILFSTPIKHSYKVVDGVYGPTAKKAGQPKTKVINELLNLGGFGIPTFLTTEYKAKGVYQSGDKILQKILKDYKDPLTQEFVKALQDYRATSKILGTYVYGINNKGDEQGFLPLVNKADGCIHHCLDQVKAVTGRLNSHDPNMQNVPKDFRRLFPSRYPDGVIWEGDYSQLEIIVNAYLTQSEKLINDIKSGVDFHIKRAAYVAGISYEEAVQNLERYPEVWKEKRQQAKAVSYAKAYGAHPEKIAEDTGLQLEDIEKIYREEDREYPEVGEFNRQVEEEIKRNRIPTERLLSIKNKEDGTKAIREGEYQGIGYHKSVTGKIYAYLEYGTDSAKLRESGRGIYRYFKSTQIANQETQGMAADIVSLCVGRVFRTLDKMPELSAHVKMINEVHDSLVFDCENEHWANELSKVVQPILMDVTAAFTEKGLPKFNVPLNVETQIGKTWGG